jgi:hypothetical protein
MSALIPKMARGFIGCQRLRTPPESRACGLISSTRYRIRFTLRVSQNSHLGPRRRLRRIHLTTPNASLSRIRDHCSEAVNTDDLRLADP